MDEERDLLDGGFAVVDREKIIEEETREITPWYQHFINVFIAPRKMMEENFYQDPPKGASVAIIGSLLFTVIVLMLSFANPIAKQMNYDTFRIQGTSEEMLAQKYAFIQLGGVIGGIVGVFLGALVTALVIQIIKVILKDKGRFGSLYVACLLSQMVSAALMCIDRLIGLFIPTTNTVLGVSVLLSDEMLSSNMILRTVLSLFSLPSIAALIILMIGYSVITRTSLKKGIGVIIGVQAIFTVVGVAVVYIGQMALQNMGMGM